MSRRKSVSWGASPQAPKDILVLDRERVRELRQLCHPDRHSDSPLSLRTTQWLADVSKELDRRNG